MAEREDLGRPWWLLPVGRVHPLWWSVVAVVLIWIDYIAGPGTQFPVLYVLPVSVAAWYSGRWPALTLALVVPVFHLVFLMTAWQQSSSQTLAISMTVIRGAVIAVMALWFARLSEHERQLHRYVVKLEGLLSICSYCKSIRNESGSWESLERFISQRSDASFSHGLCPRCVREHYSPGQD